MQKSLLYPLLRLRLAVAEFLRPHEVHVLLVWAGLVGFAGACASVAFRELMHEVQWLITGHSGSLVQTARDLPVWACLLVPTGGGLLAGGILYGGSVLLKGQKSPDYIEAIALGDGRIPSRITLVKAASSLVTIATGGSIGREGPMVQLSAMLASLLGKILGVSVPRLRLLVACGAAAGIAAAYNAPIAGSLFVAEIILGSIVMESFGPLVFASVVSVLTVRQLLGASPVYQVPAFHLVSMLELPAYLLLGILCGLMAPWFLQLLALSARNFAIQGWPAPLRLGAAGFIVGAISMYMPEVWGNGYSVVNEILHQDIVWYVLLLFLALKLVATASTVGAGAVGGVFTPTLCVGAVLGSLVGQGVHAILPHHSGLSGSYALVGMGCFLAATTHAPLMAILMIFEMTLDYDIVLPLMLGCVTAYYTAHAIRSDSIYAESLRRGKAQSPLASLCVGDLLKPNPLQVPPHAPFHEVAQIFAQNQHNYLYVTDDAGIFRGMISLHDIKSYLSDESLAQIVIAADIVRDDFPTINPEAPVLGALENFKGAYMERLVVVDKERKLLGTISKTDLLLTLAHQERNEANKV